MHAKRAGPHYMIIVLTLISLCLPCSGTAADPDGFHGDLILTPMETAWLSESKTIRVGGPRAFPPFHYYDDQGVLKGISADYLFTIMDRIGLEVEVTGPVPWNQVLEKAKSGQIDLIPCIAKTPAREEFLDFSRSYLSFPLVILSRKDAPFIGGIQDLHGKTLAVIRKSVTIDWLGQDGIEFNPVYVDTPFKRLEAVSLGRVDAGIENLAAASYIIHHFGLTNIKIAAPTPYGNYNLYMGVRKNQPELLGIVNKILDRTTPEQHMQIRNKWLSVRYEHGIRKTDLVKWISAITAVASFFLAVILIANRKLKREISARHKLINELEAALEEIKTLEGMIPICSSCKKIRDDSGYWNLLETYIERHSDASFTHSMCPECAEQLYGDQKWYHKKRKETPER